MKKIYYLWYLLWLLPIGLSALGGQQALVYYGIQNTLQNGAEYEAEVVEFEMKHMAAQSNGMIILKFTTDTGEIIQRKLSLPIQNAGMLMESKLLQIKYLESSYQPVIIMPTLWFQTNMVLINIGVILLSVLVTLYASALAHRYANRLRNKTINVQPEFEYTHS
ncbi:MAG: hypothetical protein WD491_08950 [Balneolales bacterium]